MRKKKRGLFFKILKNTIMSQFYHNCVSIDKYFNRKIPVGISVFLTTIIQINGGVLLTLLAIVFSEMLDGIWFVLFFSFLALAQAFFQTQKDYRTFESLYEQSMFVYGYNNKKATATNAFAYSVLNIINNPAVFVPFLFYPAFFYENVFVTIGNSAAVLMIHQTMFFFKNVRMIEKNNNDFWKEIVYVIKSALFTIAFLIGIEFLFNHLAINKEIDLGSISLWINEGLEKIFYVLGVLAPLMVLALGGIFFIIYYVRCETSRCYFYCLEKGKTSECRLIIRLATFIKDRKVKSDLLIIGRRKDIWKQTTVLSILFPNTSILLVLFVFRMLSNECIDINVASVLITAFIFEIYVIYNYIFKNMSFMLFHNSELKNIELYRMSKKDKLWLLAKKIKLMNILGMVPTAFTGILFGTIALYLKKWWMLLVIIVLMIVCSILFAYLNLYWMFHYKVEYNSYEEFGTKIIYFSSLSKYSSIPGLLFIVPFLANMANYIYGENFITQTFIFSYMAIVILLFIVFSCIILRWGLVKYGK